MVDCPSYKPPFISGIIYCCVWSREGNPQSSFIVVIVDLVFLCFSIFWVDSKPQIISNNYETWFIQNLISIGFYCSTFLWGFLSIGTWPRPSGFVNNGTQPSIAAQAAVYWCRFNMEIPRSPTAFEIVKPMVWGALILRHMQKIHYITL